MFVTRPCLVSLYVCFVIRNINYCCSCSFYTATLYIEIGPISSTHASAARSPRLQARALEGVNNKTTEAIRLSARIKSFVTTLFGVVLFSCVVILLRHVEELFRKSAAERGRCCSTRTFYSTIPGVSWSFNGSGWVVSCEHGCWTRTRRHNSSSRYLSSYADEVRLCRPTPEARDSSLTSGWRPGYSLCRLLAADHPLALPFLVLFPLMFRLTLTVLL